MINGVVGLLKDAPTNKNSKIKLLGRFCLLFKYIPRGKGKAPKIVLPPETVRLEDLESQLELAKIRVNDLSMINRKATFKHLYFGVLNKKQTIRFLETHTKHHLKIIRDILKV